jgi:Carboxypeptidase regulatory-like domain
MPPRSLRNPLRSSNTGETFFSSSRGRLDFWPRRPPLGLLVAALALVLTAPAAAQYTVGRIEGAVTDSTGAMLADAKVTLLNLQTNATRSYTTGPDGLYVFFALPPGKYRLTAAAPKFASRTAELTLESSETRVVHLALPLPEQAVRVEVRAAPAGALDSGDAQLSTTLSEREVENLPTAGRNEIGLVSLAAGVVPTNNPRGGSTFGGGLPGYVITIGVQSGLIAANGGRATANSVQLDYTDANDWEAGGFAPGLQAISPDMLQEFKLLTGNFSAEYDVKSNAQIILVTKSGTNRWHGDAYDLVRNRLFNARDYFDRTGKPSQDTQNIYGLTLGGPLRKNRTFFFVGYEGRKTRGAAVTNVVTLPTATARARATDPIIVSLMKEFLPLPTAPTSNPDLGTRAVQIPSPVDDYQYILKLDHRFSESHSLSARYLQGGASFIARFPADNLLPGFDADDRFRFRNVNLADTYVFSPRTVNELRFGYGYSSGVASPQNGLATPRFQILGLVNFGALDRLPTARVFNVYQWSDIVSRVEGRHILRLGGDLRLIHDNSIAEPDIRGLYTFSSLDAFLAAQPSSWVQLFGPTRRLFRTALYGLFAEDDWKVTKSLTVNLGLRWDFQGALREANGQSSVLDPATPGSIGVAGPGPLGSFRIGGDAIGANPADFAPRFGFAWNPGGSRFVLRGGYGIYWDSFTFAPLAASRFAPPLNYTFRLAGAQISAANSFDNLINGTAPILGEAAGAVGGFDQLLNFGTVSSLARHLSDPYVQQFSLGVECLFGSSYVARIGYVGTKGTHLTRLVPINPVTRGPAPATSPTDEAARLAEFETAFAEENGPGNLRLDPRFDQVNFLDDGSSSIYHSLQLELRKSFSRGLEFQGFYTWSKSIDDASDFVPAIQANDNSFPQNTADLAAERAVSNFDLRHRIIVLGIWELPFFRDQRGLLGHFLGGWSFQSVNMWQTGLPATILAGPRLGIPDVNLDGNFITPGLDNTRANCSPRGTSFQLGNPAATSGYSQPLLGNNGTCGRNTVRMSRLVNFDWAFSKTIPLAETGPGGSGPWQLDFRAELFNIFNNPFLTATGTSWRTVSSPSFGQFNNAGSARKVQLDLRVSW